MRLTPRQRKIALTLWISGEVVGGIYYGLPIYRAAARRERDRLLETDIAIVHQIESGALKADRNGVVLLPPSLATVTANGRVYVGTITIQGNSGVPAYMFPWFVRGRGMQVAGYVYVPAGLPRFTFPWGEYWFSTDINAAVTSSDYVEAAKLETNDGGNTGELFCTHWPVFRYIPSLPQDAAHPVEKNWYFADPFYDD